MSLSSLPEDIGVDIFKTLPLNTIGMSRCVCKPLYSLLSSRRFIKSHTKQTLQNNRNPTKLLFRSIRPGSQNLIRQLHSVDYASISSALSSASMWRVVIPKVAVVRKYFPLENRNHYYEIMGSCNGLICLGFETESCVWNPLTGDYKLVPNSHKHEVLYGFGYDDDNEDYKLVRIGSNEVEVFTLGTDSWKSIPRDGYTYTCPGGESENASGLLFNGALHWLQLRHTRTRDSDHVIVSFDVSNELLTEFPLPEQPSYGQYIRLGVWGDYLCLAFSTPYAYQFDVWVMQNYGVEVSWTKQFSHDYTYPFSPRKPIWSFENGEILMEMDRWFTLLDPKHQRYRTLDTRGVMFDQQSMSYMESLVLPN